MKDETFKKYEIKPLFEHFNEKHILKPYGYQHMFNYLANIHLSDTDQGVGVIIENQYAWVLVSFTIEIKKPITEIKPFIGRTWFSGNVGPYYRREYEIKNQKDETIAVASSFSVLLDMKTRSVYRQKELPFEKLKEHQIYLTEAQTRFRLRLDYDLINTRKVYNSHLDSLGHVNNLRYAEYIYDAFSEEEVNNLKNINKMELYFHHEMKLNHEFTVERSKTLDNTIFSITNKSLNVKAFSIVFHYSEG